jgi:YVTN family beta-propeller protein
VIAITRVNWNDQGEIIDADIVFNGRDFTFSLNENTTPSGQIDLQEVLTHEAGHFLGLDHTPLVGDPKVRPTMNPFNTTEAPREARTLEQDDRSGLTALYPASNQTGGISGQILRTNGTGAFGVHVVVYQAGTNTFLASSLSGSAGTSRGTGGDGCYEILGLPSGDYNVAIEPINSSITHENFGGIFNEPFDTNFNREYYNNVSLQTAARLIHVSPGITTPNIDFALGSTLTGPPAFLSAQLPVNTPDTQGPYRFSVNIGDDKGITTAQLHYRINGGPILQKTMTRTGEDTYTSDIVGQPQGTKIEYRIIAQDTDGYQTALPEQEQPMLTFEVITFSGSPVVYIALRNAHALSIIDTGPGTEVARIPTHNTPLSAILTPDNKYVFIANTGESQNSTENRITVVETATHQVAATIDVGNAPLDFIASPDGKFVYVSNSQNHSISVIDVATLAEKLPRLQIPTISDGPFGLAISPDGKQLYATDIDAGQVLVINTQTGAIQSQITAVSSPRSLALSPNGTHLYVAGFNGNIGIINTQTLSQTQIINTGTSSIFRVALSPDGTQLFATDRLNAKLIAINTAQNQIVQSVSIPNARETRDLYISPEGDRIYVTNQDAGGLVVFDAQSLQIIHTYPLTDGPRGVVVLNTPAGYVPAQNITFQADFDGDGAVGFADFLLFATAFGATETDARFNAQFDLDTDRLINFKDFLLFAGVFGKRVNL